MVSYAALIVYQDNKPDKHTDNIMYLNQPDEFPKHTALPELIMSNLELYDQDG